MSINYELDEDWETSGVDFSELQRDILNYLKTADELDPQRVSNLRHEDSLIQTALNSCVYTEEDVREALAYLVEWRFLYRHPCNA